MANIIHRMVDRERTAVVAKVSPSLAAGSCGQLLDKHRVKAAEMFGVDYADVTDEQRRAGKVANYIEMYSCPCMLRHTKGQAK